MEIFRVFGPRLTVEVSFLISFLGAFLVLASTLCLAWQIHNKWQTRQ